MEKVQYYTINYKSISKFESTLLNKITSANLVIFGVQEAMRLTSFKRDAAHNLLTSLANKGFVLRLFRNKYCLAESIAENKFAISTTLFAPAYISFWAALSFYGFTEQHPQAVQVACTKQFKPIKLKEITVLPITVKPASFFGYFKENGFSIASKEKALVDSIMHIEQIGFLEVIKCLKKAWPSLNHKMFFEYLFRVNNKSINSRVGYLTEELNLPIETIFLKKLLKNSSKGFIKLNSMKPKTKLYNKKWKIIVNDNSEEEVIL